MSLRLVACALLVAGVGVGALGCSSEGGQTSSSVAAPALLATAESTPVAAPKPTTGDCSDPTLTRRQRVECKFAALADQGIATADAITTSSMSERLSPAQRQAVANVKGRLQKEKVRGADRLASLSRKRDARCPLAECDATLFPACAAGDGDGICEAGESCLEVMGDGIGDDQQPCAPTKGARREECVLVCDDEAVCRDDENLDPELQAHLEGELDEATSHAKVVERGVQTAAKATTSALAALGEAEAADDPCAVDFHGQHRASDEVAKWHKIAAVASRGVADVAERACDQAVLGFNGASGCWPFEAIAGLAAVASELIEGAGDVVDSATLDAALACVDAVNQKAAGNEAELELVQEALERVEGTQAEIVQLLLTPPGLRPGFPKP